MQFTWDDTKRRSNLLKHGLDFRCVAEVFSGPTFTFEDDRLNYLEQRLVTLGFLDGNIVSLVHTETEYEIHCISFRHATKREEAIFFKNINA
jgi:uncharacterized protein